MRCFDPGVDVATLVLSHVDSVDTRVALASVSRTWRNAARLPESRPARYDSMLLRVLRESCPALKGRWPESQAPEDWHGVTMEDGRVVELSLRYMDLGGPVPAVIGKFTSLRKLDLGANELKRLPAEIGQLTSLEVLYLDHNQLTSVPAEIGQLTSLWRLDLGWNQLTSVPAEIGQLTSLTELNLYNNQMTSVPAEIGQLTSLRELWLNDNKLTTLPAAIGELRAAGCDVWLDEDVTNDE
jgi:leucine-rich repeat protein SHOC2